MIRHKNIFIKISTYVYYICTRIGSLQNGENRMNQNFEVENYGAEYSCCYNFYSLFEEEHHGWW